jgi:hypothetical protein
MYTDHESGALKKLRRIQWPFQQTFGTPLRTIQPFSAAIVDALAPTLSARVVIDLCRTSDYADIGRCGWAPDLEAVALGPKQGLGLSA